MFLKEHEHVSINILTNRQRERWKRKLGIIRPGVVLLPSKLLVHWSMVYKNGLHRTSTIKLQCDCCGRIFDRQISQLDPLIPTHYCSVCGFIKPRDSGYKQIRNRGFKPRSKTDSNPNPNADVHPPQA